jgi:hypothetical protein
MTLYFPYDNRTDYPGKIIFRAFAPPVPEVSVSGIGSLANELYDGFINVTDPSADVELDDRIRYSAQSPGAQQRIDNARKVVLYLPQAIIFADQADYESNVQLGVLGGTAENVINRGGSAAAAIAGATREGVSVLNDIITGNTGATGAVARLAVTRIANSVGGDTAGNVASSVLRVAVNPNKRTLFRAVNIREFAFQFKMIANSEREAIEIEQIIRYFRSELYPATIPGAEIIGYNFPNLFDIQMKYNNQQVATKIKPSYLRNVQITYNPSSMGWHSDGRPSEVDMTLAFVEERALDKSDVARGF